MSEPRTVSVAWAPSNTTGPSGVDHHVSDERLASLVKEHGWPDYILVRNGDSVLRVLDMDDRELDIKNWGAIICAKALYAIAKTGEHPGVFGGEEVEAAAQAIMQLLTFKKAVLATLELPAETTHEQVGRAILDIYDQIDGG
jgi:hypothetical protein